MQVEKLKKDFCELFGVEPLIIRSPGRVNIIGEHTDYNDGFVLPAAINKAAYLAISLRTDDEIHLIAQNLNEKYSIKIDDLKPDKLVNWPNYILGVVDQFSKRGLPLKGFNAILNSDVPMGAGVSSSAAVECATAFGLNELLNTNLSRLELVNIAQKAEHEYAGVLCGIMDQFASTMGKKDHVMKIDCRSLDFEYVPFNLNGIKILLLNTNVKHTLALSTYNTRRTECKQAIEWIQEFIPQISTLRDVNIEMLNMYVLPKNAVVYNRAKFIIEELNRVENACQDLKNDDVKSLGKKMFETHDGLKNLYEVSCKELDFLIDSVKNKTEVIGARMMGGGFGGCTINLVKEEKLEELINQIKPAYEEKMNLPLSYLIATIENGTEIIN